MGVHEMSGVYDVDIGEQTPSAGPWTLTSGLFDQRYITDANDNVILASDDDYYVLSNDANLFLFAAAPDLLEALEDVTAELKHRFGYDNYHTQQAYDAINKAKGLTK